MIETDYDNTPPWFFDILCEEREGLQAFLEENNIGTREFYSPLHSEPVYGYDLSYPTTEEISAKGLWLPSSIRVTDEHIEYVCTKIREYYTGRKG